MFGILARLERPLLLAGLGVDRVQVAVPAADVDHVADDGRRGMHDVIRRELPLQHAAARIDRVDIAVAAAEVHLAIATAGDEVNTSHASGMVCAGDG